MTLSTWQLIVVGALATIWAVVLGVPLLADLLHWFRTRPPPSQLDERPRHRRLADGIGRAWRARPRPVATWRSQPVERRRLQRLLACGMATVVAMFLAIAFRGLFITLFAFMVVLSLVILAVGVFIGAREHRRLRSQPTGRARERPAEQTRSTMGAIGSGDVTGVARRSLASFLDPVTDGVPTANPWQTPDGEYTIPSIAEITEAFRNPNRDGFMFEPLNLDEALIGESRRADVFVPDVDIDVPVDPDLVAELGLDLDAVREPRFEAAPEVGPRQASARARRGRRSKARPIYIESVLDEQDDQGRAMNE
ncbi:MAG: hypothetical protein OER95_11420 [Acidimicrobiia bacterium]|nr:hypothetical protein [Acidimicrobiia bacterium]